MIFKMHAKVSVKCRLLKSFKIQMRGEEREREGKVVTELTFVRAQGVVTDVSGLCSVRAETDILEGEQIKRKRRGTISYKIKNKGIGSFGTKWSSYG